MTDEITADRSVRQSQSHDASTAERSRSRAMTAERSRAHLEQATHGSSRPPTRRYNGPR
jgi:hypothetical protein